MTVLNSGTTKKYSEQWDAVFGDGKPKKKIAATQKKAASKKPAKKKGQKKS